VNATAPEPALKPLSAYPTPAPPVRLLALTLVAAGLVLAASMPFTWHHIVIPAAGYRLVRGMDGATWAAGIAALSLVMAAWFWRNRPAFYSKWCVTFLAFTGVLGIFVDNVNWNARAAQLYVTPYDGPGFFVALGGMAILVIATVRVWSVRD
jgi:hypothetical protein